MSSTTDSLTEQLVAANRAWTDGRTSEEPPVRPARRLVVVTCMDTRIPVLDALGLSLGEAHILRNAGGIVTDDTIRSVLLSQEALGTTDVVVMTHTDCGVSKLDEATVAHLDATVSARTGAPADVDYGGFTDPAGSARASVDRLRTDPRLGQRDTIVALVFDVETGRVDPA